MLVVDDDVNLLDLIRQILELHGLACDTAEDGLAAFNKIQKRHYKLIVSDIRMPNMNGTELLKAVRNYQKSKTPKSRVVLMTAYSTAEIMEQADRLGVDDFLTKPFDIVDFVKRLRDILGECAS